MNDPFAREPTEQENALIEAKTKFVKAAAGAMSVIMLTVLACLPAIAIIAWKAAL